MTDVVVIGTGGHAKVVADIVRLNKDNLIGFLTSDRTLSSFVGKPILGLDTEYKKFINAHFIVAIGNSTVRERIVTSMPDAKWYTAIHPSAVIAQTSVVGEGTVVSANAVINPYSKIGKHCIINTNSTVEHDNTVEDFSHISVGTMLAGNVTIGRKTWVGIGASVKNGITICDNCMIGAGAVVVKNIVSQGVYIGVPAKKMNS